MVDAESPENQKLVDDGLSTLLALLKCEEAYKVNAEAAPNGLPWTANLLEVFSSGLRVKVVKYEDDEDRDERFRWNVAKHDVDNNSVRWSSCHQKIMVPCGMFKKLGDWEAVRKGCRSAYSEGKSDSYNRWIRAAKGISPAVLEQLKKFPKIPPKFVFDNHYLVTSSTNLRNKLSDAAATRALLAYSKYNADEDKDMTSDCFINVVCRGNRLLEVWRGIIEARFGTIAKNSPAFIRLCEHLSAMAGLNAILSCAQAGLNLHGKSEAQQGIPECYQMVREMERCKAGSLPPPESCPDEAAVQKRIASDKAKEEALLKAEAEAKATAQAAEDYNRKEVELKSLNAETEMFSLATPMGSPPSSAPIALSVEGAVKECVDSRMQKLHMASGTEELKLALAPFIGDTSRVVVLVDGITTEKEAFAHMIDVAKNVWDQYAAGTGAGPTGQTKFRIVILLGSRWDLFDKVSKKKAALFPKWAKFKAQVEARGWQSRCVHPSDVIVLCPMEDLGRESTLVKVDLRKADIANEGVRDVCSDAGCPWRAAAAQGTQEPAEGEPNIDVDDKVDLLQAMLEEECEAEGPADESSGVSVDGSMDAKHLDSKLWPYGRTLSNYTRVLEEVGALGKTTLAVIVSTTAHPSHWVSCLHKAIETFVFTRKWSHHSKHHGLVLGKKLLLDQALREITMGPDAGSASPANSLQCLRLTVPDGPQLLEAHECQQGDAWNDGLNHMVPAAALDAQSAKLCVSEQEQFNLTIIGSGADRNLVTVKGLAPGAVACNVSALFYDDWGALQSFLSLPGNAQR